MSDFDTMRWGDTQSVELSTAQVNPESGIQFAKSSQMLNARWQRPLVWKLMLSVSPFIADSDSAAAVTVIVSMFVGVGQANALVPLASFNFTAGSYDGITEFFDIPAEAIQLQFEVFADPPCTSLGSVVTVSAFAAPITEPRVMADVRELLRRHLGKDLPFRDDPTDGKPMHHFPLGDHSFNDGVMRGRR